MNILYTTNELFASKVAASMCSVMENNKNVDEVVFYIVGQGLSEASMSNYKMLGRKYCRSIEIINVNNIMEYLKFDFDTSGWNPISMARLAVDQLLPESVERVLYLDGDTINIASLEELWNTDMHGKALGACIEATVDKKRKKSLGMGKIPYINSGVLLIDLKLWREEETGSTILNYYKDNNGMLVANDQNAINGALKEQIFYLEPRYNFYNIYWYYPYKVLKKLMGHTKYYSEQVVEDSKKSPAIIHYLGEERPWRKGNRHKYRAEYFRYLKKTPWKNEEMESGWELYFLCWDIFNFVIRPFPMLRYKIINGLIPVFMEWRTRNIKKEKAKMKG